MKQQNSYSFFCCFCEEPRKRNNQKRRPFEGPNQIYKIDTNSYYSEKIIPQPQPNNIVIDPPKEKEKESIKSKNTKNDEFEEIRTIDSYYTINNKNKKENNVTKKEYTNNHKNKYKNILQNDINSFLEKKERKEIPIENLSSILKKYETEKINNISIQEEKNKISEKAEEKKTEEIKKDTTEKIENKKELENKENKNNNSIKLNNKINNDIKTDYNQKNNMLSNPSSIKINEKENTISQTIKRINKFEFEDNITQERLLWKNKSNLNQKIKSAIINNNNINSNINTKPIQNNNIIDNSKQTSPNKSIQNETSDDRNTNPINQIPIENDISCEKVKEETISKKETINNKSNKSNNNHLKKIKNENNTMVAQKGNSKFSTINNDANSFNSALELKANLNKIKIDSTNNNVDKISEKKIDNKSKKQIDNKSKKEIDNKSKKEIITNNIPNIEPKQEIVDNTNIIDSQSIKENKSTNNNLSIKEGINIKLNYLTEFCPSNTAQEEKKVEESKTSNIQKDSISEEIDDEVGSIDEFNNTNDNRSILSSYIFSSVRPTESNKSFASSIYGKSDSQELVSNYNEIMSNKGMRILPMEFNNNREVEIRMDNLPRNTKNYFISMRMNEIKRKKEKITEKEKLIKNNYDNIEKMKKKIENIDNEEKQYERWIEKEEEENENLIYLLNFLMNVNK